MQRVVLILVTLSFLIYPAPSVSQARLKLRLVYGF
jgi:hypothetical protein